MTRETRACIYPRSAIENDNAIQEQLEACENRAHLKCWQVVSTHIDNGEPGTIDYRGGLISLRRAVEAKECDVILAEDFIRIYREMEKYLIFEEDCRRQGVKLCFLNGFNISSFDFKRVRRPPVAPL